MQRRSPRPRFGSFVVLGALALVAAVGCDPFFTFPGGALSGEVKPPPADWSFTDEVETVQLESRPADPYSVNVWVVAVDDDLYVAGAPGGSWPAYVDANPEVRLRVAGDVYELRAVRTDDPADREAFLAAAKQKYDFEPDPDDASGASLFRLGPR